MGSSYVVSSGVTSSGVVLSFGDAETVLDGGTALDTRVRRGGVETVQSGGLASGDRIGAGGLVSVDSGGLDSAATISSGGVMSLASGAVASGATVAVGGQLVGTGQLWGSTYDYGLVSGVSLGHFNYPSSDHLFVESGGVASDVTLLDAFVTISDGGVGRDIVISDGIVTVESGGALSGADVVDYGQIVVSSGAVASDARVFGGDLIVLGSAAGTVVSRYSNELVYSGGTETGGVVHGGGRLYVYPAGSAVDVVVSRGGRESVDATGTVSGGAVLSGGVVSVIGAADISGLVTSSGGEAVLLSQTISDTEVVDPSAPSPVSGITAEPGAELILVRTTIAGGGVLSLGAGARAAALTVNAGGVLEGEGAIYVRPGGRYTYDFGLVSGVSVGDAVSSGFLVVDPDGVASGVTVSSGNLYVYGSAADTTVEGGQFIGVFSKGMATGATLRGLGEVQAGGALTDVTVSSGGELLVLENATVSGAQVLSGGLDDLQAYGVEQDVRISSGGTLELDDGYVSSGKVLTAGIMSASKVISGATLLRGAGLRTYDLRVESGGEQIVTSAGSAFYTILSSGGVMDLRSGGVATQLQVLPYAVVSGAGEILGYSDIDLDGVASGVTLGSGAFVAVAGLAKDVTVASGATENVADDPQFESLRGVVSGGAVEAGGVLQGGGGLSGTVTDLGLVSGVSIGSGGVLRVLSGGATRGVKVEFGGVLSDEAGGVVTGGAVEDGGLLSGQGAVAGALRVSGGGRVEDVSFAKGASVVDDGVVAHGGAGSMTLAAALKGSGLLLQSGPGMLSVTGPTGSFKGEAEIDGGVLALTTSAGLGGAPIAFEAGSSGSAVLALAGAARPASNGAFASELVDFDGGNEALDLAKRAYVSGATATVSSGVLTLNDGAYTASFVLGGTSAASYAVSGDGQGGTLITPTGGEAMQLGSAMAAFAPAAGSPAGLSAFSLQSAQVALAAAPNGPHRPH